MGQMSDVLKNIRQPERGWIRAVRDALEITGSQLYLRLGVSKQRIPVLEKTEIEGGVSLNSMRQAAEALCCDLVYALLPRDVATGNIRRKAIMRELEELYAP